MLGNELIKAVFKDKSVTWLQGWSEDGLERKGPAVRSTKGRGPGARQQGLLGREESEVTLVCLSLKFLILKMFIFLYNNKCQNFGIGPVLLGLQSFSSAYSIISKRYPVLGFLQ